MKFATLFKRTSTGASQQWAVSVQEHPNVAIVTVWGQVGGATQTTLDVVTAGKNLGKANETTPLQQAHAEAQSLWEGKLKKGYTQSLEDARAGKVDAIITGGVEPMLAHRYDEQGHKIKWPGFVQPKLDGHRCIAIVANGEATLWSRTRKPITGLPHLQKQLTALGASVVLDGELYVHSYRSKFEELTSFIRTPEPKPGHEVLEYHVYDIVDGAGVSQKDSFASRTKALEELGLTKQPNLKLVETRAVLDEDELMLAFDAFLEQGYEGAMVRNAAGPYTNKRSYDLQKVKEFADADFLITGIEEGRGKLAGHAIFVCETEDGTPFKAKLKGETSALKRYFDDPALSIGRMLTVKYQGLTGKAKVPRFPVGLRLKEDV